MADMREFGKMDVEDRGGKHDYSYADERDTKPSYGLTPSQTVGPFFAYGLTPGAYGYPLNELHTTSVDTSDMEGTPILLEGQVFDGNGAPVHDAIVEMIQADATGRYIDKPRNDNFNGYFRAGTGPQGASENGGDTRYHFQTIKPGASQPGAAPFVTLIITMRGLLNHCITRAYFEGDDFIDDPVLSQVPKDRQDTLVSRHIAENHFRFDIHMQGDRETVFFDI